MFRSPLVFVICSTLAFASQPADVHPVNEKVLEFSRDSIGKEIGSGECTGLAQEALEAAGAKPFHAFVKNPQNGNIVWGELAYELEVKNGERHEEKLANPAVESGDIVQLSNVLFEGRGARPYRMFTQQHTAVVNFVSKDGSKWNVIQQNVNGKKSVTKGVYLLNDLKKGSIRVYRPVPMSQES
ncbi:MAG: hypothetical protein WD065_07485, partial [Planctomycetaceae bacterium]